MAFSFCMTNHNRAIPVVGRIDKSSTYLECPHRWWRRNYDCHLGSGFLSETAIRNDGFWKMAKSAPSRPANHSRYDSTESASPIRSKSSSFWPTTDDDSIKPSRKLLTRSINYANISQNQINESISMTLIDIPAKRAVCINYSSFSVDWLSIAAKTELLARFCLRQIFFGWGVYRLRFAFGGPALENDESVAMVRPGRPLEVATLKRNGKCHQSSVMCLRSGSIQRIHRLISDLFRLSQLNVVVVLSTSI